MRSFLVVFFLAIQLVSAQKVRVFNDYTSDSEKKWVDSIYNGLSFQERVGQLFMVAAYSNKDSTHVRGVDKLITDYKIGGLIFFQGGPVRQAKLTNRFQKKSKIPLFIGIDGEWGLSMRLDSTYRYPWNMTLGAVQDMKLIEKMGQQMAIQAKRMGIHFNFAPVVDINTNPVNPIIGNRSFGEDKFLVTERASALMRGIQSEGVFATGKHFPGHGDTSTDSHHALPFLNFTKERLNDVEFYPYKRLFNEGLASIMVAHLNVPSIEPTPNYPTSLSYNVVTNIVQDELGFKGLIFTDALNMKGASGYMQPGDIDLEAFLAGNDVLLFAENVPVAIEKFRQAYADGVLSEDRLQLSVKKILAYKYRGGLNKYKPIDLANLYNDLNGHEYDDLNYQLYESAVTVLKNEQETVPVMDLSSEKIAYVKLGDDDGSTYLTTLQKYADVTEVQEDTLSVLSSRLKNYSTVIVGYHKADGAWKKHDLSAKELTWLDTISKNRRVIFTNFAKPYTLIPIKSFGNIKTVIQAYQNNTIAQTVAAEIVFGAIGSKGKLPVTIGSSFKLNDGLFTRSTNRLAFTTPENAGMSTAKLSKIDMIAQRAIKEKMTPGIQVLVARHGKVIYQKSFGYHTYDNDVKVKNSDVYDVASLTKILSTLPNVMQLYDTGKVNLETKLGDMIPALADTDKKNITLKDMLLHQARFQAWIPFYQETLDSNKKPDSLLYRKAFSPEFPNQVAENLFLVKGYNDTIVSRIGDSKLLKRKEYKYSDFTFILLKEYLEKQTGKPLDILAQDAFYKPLGASYTTYNPLRKFDMSVIPPTEIDNYFRYQVIQGYVHDMAAAMEDGIAGHAGLFSNAMDVAKIMQMYLNKGNYGGRQYFSAKTFDTFNTCYACKEGNRRGLGFDKPQIEKSGPTCGCVSKESFGHTGFTGTMTWADPETGIIYVFLANRTYPEAGENRLSKENIREDIQKAIQEAIIE
ncbi:glycoside hydrolase family 3 N-terminal domain-containing protein [Flavobacterium sp. DG1-102-2]|uniref:glycoside hydrolase family 3 N-terminal domain-containing protein n=1 Tax=Flavobacterium sp. DG1-102-2 TaxID=3081663 RepID=UPI002948F875|nr:glycoside hydrolase family 3 N-terminal domain-containing protein [Flavobacterium sp. DG1-102-2]MDV6166827.1 glycoside hydrolase family 3 N-terminal domain-containing protein [Flavobacterium sp. DG1-102-2]